MSEIFVSLVVLFSKRSVFTCRKDGAVSARLLFCWYALFNTDLFFSILHFEKMSSF